MTKEGRFEHKECQVVSLFGLTSKQVNKRREHSMGENWWWIKLNVFLPCTATDELYAMSPSIPFPKLTWHTLLPEL